MLEDVASLDNQMSTSSLHVTFLIENCTVKVPSNSERSSNPMYLYSYSVGKMVATFVVRSVVLNFFFLAGTVQE